LRYERTIRHCKLAEFEAAERELVAAYCLVPSLPIVFNVAQSCRLAGKRDQALRLYRKYLALSPGAQSRRGREADRPARGARIIVVSCSRCGRSRSRR
jgi:hypothetical protein